MKHLIYIAGALFAGGVTPAHAQTFHRADPAAADAAVPATNYSSQLKPPATLPVASPASNWRALNVLVTSYDAMAPAATTADAATAPTSPAATTSSDARAPAASPDPHAHHHAGAK